MCVTIKCWIEVKQCLDFPFSQSKSESGSAVAKNPQGIFNSIGTHDMLICEVSNFIFILAMHHLQAQS